MTDEEKRLLEGLRFCAIPSQCGGCPIYEPHKHCGRIPRAINLIEKLARERDAAVRDIGYLADGCTPCSVCAKGICDIAPDQAIDRCVKFDWRGGCAESTGTAP